MSRRSDRFVLGLALLALVGVLTVGLSAHLAVSKTLPADASTVSAAPARIQVWFTQQPSPRVSLLQMKGPGGDVPLGEISLSRQDRSIAAPVDGTLTPGTYEVTWRTAGDDGHVLRGSFTFSLQPTE